MDSLNNKHSKTIIENGNQFLGKLIKNQLNNVRESKKLFVQDMKRICKNINSDPFDKNKCCIWNGYITNINKRNKGTYINFYFKKKKIALHRLLYENYVSKLTSDDYLKFTCPNKGKCCNINHLKKFKYKKSNFKIKIDTETNEQISDKTNEQISDKINEQISDKTNGIIKFW